ncbi:hypothetical protein SARC_04707 [Sphaeroforma arctica JP610]|uniref:Uncharacterized protein n=1 Tax=Sphaeroforma arctica JP610 TaxID=667725 RepID=A0A0L0G458_9EUKA|nr:hypothetical protein SARC_04707 [Sphaeroforma arctica JP610]KNC83018.1 hypothetical protein SARC_04707 [Sphaeroforma arctica JP610]|eukprot:XP_014156920.1 hypothetical protein SARC_04707 [Sphaeroforma arctica JP610]
MYQTPTSMIYSNYHGQGAHGTTVINMDERPGCDIAQSYISTGSYQGISHGATTLNTEQAYTQIMMQPPIPHPLETPSTTAVRYQQTCLAMPSRMERSTPTPIHHTYAKSLYNTDSPEQRASTYNVPLFNPLPGQTTHSHILPSSENLAAPQTHKQPLNSATVPVTSIYRHVDLVKDLAQTNLTGRVAASFSEGLGCPDEVYGLSRTRGRDSDTPQLDFNQGLVPHSHPLNVTEDLDWGSDSEGDEAISKPILAHGFSSGETKANSSLAFKLKTNASLSQPTTSVGTRSEPLMPIQGKRGFISAEDYMQTTGSAANSPASHRSSILRQESTPTPHFHNATLHLQSLTSHPVSLPNSPKHTSIPPLHSHPNTPSASQKRSNMGFISASDFASVTATDSNWFRSPQNVASTTSCAVNNNDIANRLGVTVPLSCARVISPELNGRASATNETSRTSLTHALGATSSLADTHISSIDNKSPTSSNNPNDSPGHEMPQLFPTPVAVSDKQLQNDRLRRWASLAVSEGSIDESAGLDLGNFGATGHGCDRIDASVVVGYTRRIQFSGCITAEGAEGTDARNGNPRFDREESGCLNQGNGYGEGESWERKNDSSIHPQHIIPTSTSGLFATALQSHASGDTDTARSRSRPLISASPTTGDQQQAELQPSPLETPAEEASDSDYEQGLEWPQQVRLASRWEDVELPTGGLTMNMLAVQARANDPSKQMGVGPNSRLRVVQGRSSPPSHDALNRLSGEWENDNYTTTSSIMSYTMSQSQSQTSAVPGEGHAHSDNLDQACTSGGTTENITSPELSGLRLPSKGEKLRLRLPQPDAREPANFDSCTDVSDGFDFDTDTESDVNDSGSMLGSSAGRAMAGIGIRSTSGSFDCTLTDRRLGSASFDAVGTRDVVSVAHSPSASRMFGTQLDSQLHDMYQPKVPLDHRLNPCLRIARPSQLGEGMRTEPMLIQSTMAPIGRQVVGSMVYNPTTQSWEGNEEALLDFDDTRLSARPTRTVPALITSLGKTGALSKEVKGMIFDSERACWRGNEEDVLDLSDSDWSENDGSDSNDTRDENSLLTPSNVYAKDYTQAFTITSELRKQWSESETQHQRLGLWNQSVEAKGNHLSVAWAVRELDVIRQLS